MSERLPGPWQVAFALIEVDGQSGGAVRFADSAERREDMCEIDLDAGVLAEQVGLRGKGCRRAREVLGFAMTASVGQYSCQNLPG